jgi:hypothetical protein
MLGGDFTCAAPAARYHAPMRPLLTGLVVGLFAVLAMACSENKAATEKCKGETSASEACQACCNSNGASGYKFMSGTCACLGG